MRRPDGEHKDVSVLRHEVYAQEVGSAIEQGCL